MNFGVCILVGGKSSRMNFQAKADLKLNDRTFLEILAQEMYSIPFKYLSVNPSQQYVMEGYTNIVDEYPSIGPMNGIVSVLHQTKVDALFVCSCDMPFVNMDVVNILYEKLEDNDGIFLQDENHTYLTAGIYTRKLLPILEKQIEKKDYRLYRSVKMGNIKLLNTKDTNLEPELLMNINTLEDYQTLKRKRES